MHKTEDLAAQCARNEPVSNGEVLRAWPCNARAAAAVPSQQYQFGRSKGVGRKASVTHANSLIYILLPSSSSRNIVLYYSYLPHVLLGSSLVLLCLILYTAYVFMCMSPCVSS